MSSRDIIDQMSELLLAGSETTSGTSSSHLLSLWMLSWCSKGTIGCLFLELARNPDVRKKLLDSLPVLGPHDAILDSKVVREDPKYRYLEACIKENLRMHPIASEMGRRTLNQEYSIGGYEIPAFTVVSASYRVTHNDEKHWPQADRFWPERWLEHGEMGDAPAPEWVLALHWFIATHCSDTSLTVLMLTFHSPRASTPVLARSKWKVSFSDRPHADNDSFAYAEIRTVSANILSRFDVEEKGYKEIDFRQYITMQFHDGKWNARLMPRWDTSVA